jgi:CRISPR-associated protein Cas6
MFWQEDEQREPQVPDDVVDLLFAIECRTLPVDHAYDLSQALLALAPWLGEDERIGVHTVHVAGSQNGWERPDPALGQVLQLSRRTKLTIRAPRERVDRLQAELTGATLEIGGSTLTIGAAKTRALSRQGTIFARYVVLESGEEQDEHQFLSRAAATLAERNIRMRKALCGKTAELGTPDGPVATRSLMLADLQTDESLRLQQQGLGPLRHMGCGIFIPHKGIEAVKKQAEDD